MLQSGQLVAPLGQHTRIQFGAHHAGFLGLLGQDLAPGVDQQRLAPGTAPIGVRAPLCRSGHEGQVLDGTGTQQHLPMRLARGVGEGAGHQQQVSAALGVGAVQLRKAQVVAHA